MTTYLDENGFPEFEKIKAESIFDNIKSLLSQSVIEIEKVCNDQQTSWDSLVGRLEEILSNVEREWSPVRHLNSVSQTEALRSAYAQCLPLLTEFYTDFSQNQKLYKKYNTYYDSNGFTEADSVQKKIIKDSLRDFKLAGVHLNTEDQKKVKAVRQQLANLENTFRDQVLDATQAWTKSIKSEKHLDGVPESGKQLLKAAAEQRGETGWLVTLDIPHYLTIMSYASNRSLREETYKAYMTRASEADTWNNGPILEEILQRRKECAALLGFDDYAQYSLQTKMAESPEQVEEFLLDLAEKSKPKAKKDLEQLQQYATDNLGLHELKAWDIPYVSEQLKESNYHFNEEELKQYFPVDRVIQGLFKLSSRLFGVSFQERKNQSIWHPQVRFYELIDREGTVQACFYLDLYARKAKQGGAWMDVCRNRIIKLDGVVTPVAYMTCNAAPPTETTPALFTHDEIVTLFHEFGHGLHHMLTEVNYATVAGINGVEWDAVESPSQFMENWCWDRRTLTDMSQHYQTGEKLPDSLFNRLAGTRTFNSGLQTLRQIEFALFDLRIHTSHQPLTEHDVQIILDTVRDQVSLIKPPDWVRFQNSFTHIFAGGYAAGYYSYKWAEVLSADIYSAFEQSSQPEGTTGERLKQTILSKGGSQSAMELFIDFRGRKPSIEPLLIQNGMMVRQ